MNIGMDTRIDTRIDTHINTRSDTCVDTRIDANTPPLLSIRGLRVALPRGADRPWAIADLNLDLRAGEILCVVGESGSGKSLTANALLGLLPEGVRVTGGQAVWEGKDDLLALSPRALRDLRGRRIGMIFQEPMSALNPLHRIGAQLGEVFRVHTTLSSRDIQAKSLELLQAVQIPDPPRALRAYPHELSGGQRQRVMIAMALALEPALLIADEPTTALDVTTQAQILQLIHDLQRRKGTAVLFITHDFGVVAEIADRVAVMQGGELVESGSAGAVLNRPSHPYTQALIAAVPSMTPAASVLTPAASVLTPAASALTPAASALTPAASAMTPAASVLTSDASTPTPARPPAHAAPPALQTQGLSKTYRPRGWFKRNARVTHAVNDVSLSLPSGATLGIVGESGSGKSTLARVILGLLTPDAGTLYVDGAALPEGGARQRRARARKIQMVFQDPYGSLNPRQRVGDIVARGPIEQGAPRAQARARARELFELVGLDPNALHRYPHEFSGGQRQRVGLARALALEPDILLADEPVSALDVSVQAQVLALLARLRDQLGLSMLFITHDLRVAAQVCDRIAVMKEGRVVEEGPSATLFTSPSHPYTQALIAAVPGRHWRHDATPSVA